MKHQGRQERRGPPENPVPAVREVNPSLAPLVDPAKWDRLGVMVRLARRVLMAVPANLERWV